MQGAIMISAAEALGATVFNRMGKGQLWGVRGRRGARIRSRRGTIWVTVDGDPNDVVLNRGEAFELPDDGTVLIQALECAWVSVEPRVAIRDGTRWERLRVAFGRRPLAGPVA
jgi:hypothetical protein